MRKTPPYILLADEDADDRTIFGEAFNTMNRRACVKAVTTGLELIDFLDACELEDLPVLIVLDYEMQSVRGPEALFILSWSKRYAFIPKIVWSNSNLQANREESIRNGAIKYYIKPCSERDLDQMIMEIDGLFKTQLARLQ